jgi:hypothetical protein
VEDDGQLLTALPWITIATEVYFAHGQLSEVRVFVPPFPIFIAWAMQRVFRVVIAGSASADAGVQGVAGAEADKRLLTAELAFVLWNQAQQRAIIATVWLLRR